MNFEFSPVEKPATCLLPVVATTLANGVKVIVVKDPKATVSAAVMSIRVGQLNDPPELPGLAHLCEHMLFLGTKKFPKEGEFDSFISCNGGSQNAYTSLDATTFYFSVAVKAFPEALDRFAHFFVDPTFTASALERETRAVNSEDEKNQSSDFWRLVELVRALSVKEHPYCQYGNGNLTTLWTEPREKGIDVRARLLDFFEKYYVSRAAAMVLFTAMEPHDVVSLIAPTLLEMQASNESAPTQFLPRGAPLFSEEYRGKWFNLQAYSEAQQSISFSFTVPYGHEDFRKEPTMYISFILGHECKGSLLAVLKAHGYAEELVTGPQSVDDVTTLFSIRITLTRKGLRNVLDVARITFEAIRLVKQRGMCRAVYDDALRSRKLHFNLDDVDSPISYVLRLSNSVRVPASLAWSSMFFPVEEDKEIAIAALDSFTPENCQIFVRWFGFPGPDKSLVEQDKEIITNFPSFCETMLSLKTRFRQMAYSVSCIPKKVTEEWGSGEGPIDKLLALPSPNPFLAENFDIKAHGTDKFPTTVLLAHGTLFVKVDDDRHCSPKCYFSIELLSNVSSLSAQNAFYVTMLHYVLQDSLTETLYFAELGKIEVSVTPKLSGIGLTIVGPNDKLLTLLKAVLNTALNADKLCESKDLLTRNYEKMIRGLLGAKSKEPFILGGSFLEAFTQKTQYSFLDMLAVVDELSIQGFGEFAQEFLKSLRYQALLLGNIASVEEGVCEYGHVVEALLDSHGVTVLPLEQYVRPDDVFQIPARQEMRILTLLPFHESNPNISVELIIQIGESSATNRVLTRFLAKLLSAPFFEALRTKESLGYVVGLNTKRSGHVVDALRFRVQSAVCTPEYALSRIYAFLEAAKDQIVLKLSDEAFLQMSESLIAAYEDYPKSITGEGEFLWALRNLPDRFRACDENVETLRKMKKEEIVNCFMSKVANDSPRRAACVFVYSNRTLKEQPALCGSQFEVQPKKALEDAQPPAQDEEKSSQEDEADDEKLSLVLPNFESGNLPKLSIKVCTSKEVLSGDLTLWARQ